MLRLIIGFSVDGFWQIKMTKLEVSSEADDNKLTLCENGCEALFDTGMGPIGGPPDDIDRIVEKVGAHFDNQSNYYVITPCEIASLPNVEFQFGEAKVILKPNDYILVSSVSHSLCKYLYSFSLLTFVLHIYFEAPDLLHWFYKNENKIPKSRLSLRRSVSSSINSHF